MLPPGPSVTSAANRFGPLVRSHCADQSASGTPLLLECCEEVGEGGVRECVALEVEAKAGGEPFTTETRAELLKDCAPFP